MFDSRKVLVGITPTCWTNDDFPNAGLGDDIPFEQCVDEIAKAGFQGCSIGRKFPEDVELLNHELQRRQLRVSEPWVSTYFTCDGLDDQTINDFRRQMSFVKEVGGRDIGVAELGNAVHTRMDADLMGGKPIFTDDQWDRLANGLNRLGNMATAAGMRLCYHPHMGTGVQTQDELTMLVERTNDNVHLLLDTGHLSWAGGKPMQVIKDYGHRIAHIHLKNVRDDVMTDEKLAKASFFDYIKAGIFTVPGDEGIVDFAPILQLLARNGYTGWLMVEAEQDPKKAPPLCYAKKARAYLREVAGL
jgi:inosose dehydratase